MHKAIIKKGAQIKTLRGVIAPMAPILTRTLLTRRSGKEEI